MSYKHLINTFDIVFCFSSFSNVQRSKTEQKSHWNTKLLPIKSCYWFQHWFHWKGKKQQQKSRILIVQMLCMRMWFFFIIQWRENKSLCAKEYNTHKILIVMSYYQEFFDVIHFSWVFSIGWYYIYHSKPWLHFNLSGNMMRYDRDFSFLYNKLQYIWWLLLYLYVCCSFFIMYPYFLLYPSTLNMKLVFAFRRGLDK